MPLDLDDIDKAALVELLREVIAADRYPLSPRIRQLRAILGKLYPPPRRPEPYPPKPVGEPEHGAGEEDQMKRTPTLSIFRQTTSQSCDDPTRGLSTNSRGHRNMSAGITSAPVSDTSRIWQPSVQCP